MRIAHSLVIAFGAAIVGTALISVVMIAGASPTEVKGDINCDQSVDPVDSLLTLRHDAGLAVNLPAGCDAIGSIGVAARSSSAVNPKGDMNCDGAVNPIDSLLLLRHDAGLTVSLPPGCDAIGSSVGSATPVPTLPETPSPTSVSPTQPPATATPTPTSTVAAATQTPVTQPPTSPPVTPTPTPTAPSTPTPTPTTTPSPTPTTTPSPTPTTTPSPTPSASPTATAAPTVIDCWLYFVVFPLLTEAPLVDGSCDSPIGSPDYQCQVTFVDHLRCETSATGWNDYSCEDFRRLDWISCDIGLTFPAPTNPRHFYCVLVDSTVLCRGAVPDYECRLVAASVVCEIYHVSGGYPGFQCSGSPPTVSCEALAP